MKNPFPGLCVTALLLAGCSDPISYAPQPEAEPAEAQDQQAANPAPAPPPPVQMPAGDAVSQDLDSIPLTLQNQDYNTAVNQLGAMGHVQGQMTEAQRRAYQQQLFETQQYLLEQSKQNAAAKEAYDRLGKQMMGR
jgi:PBP1b-binding outer membrane lipoprotein LpoB